MKSKSILEIAVRKVKEGQEEKFRRARSSFIALLKQQPGVERDWEFESFFTMPEPDTSEVFVGMTRYGSAEQMQLIANNLLGSPEAANFFATFDMKAFVTAQTVNAEDFRLEDYIASGNVLELAIRTVKEGGESHFASKRKAFFDLIGEQEGYLFDQELVDLQSGAKVVLIAWSSMELFQKAATLLQSKPEMADFFGILDVKAYQALRI